MRRSDDEERGVLVPGPRGIARLVGRDRLAGRIAADLFGPGAGLASRTADELAALGRPLTVVWCEDDTHVREIFRMAWEVPKPEHDWAPHPEDRLLFTPDGDEALAWVREERADAFFTDECHPRGPGGRALLQALAPQSHLALGYVTGCMLGPEHHEGLDLCLQKPFDIVALWSGWSSFVERLRRDTYVAPVDRIDAIAAARPL